MTLKKQFIQEGIDAVYIGKSFDEVVIFNKGKNRDIVYAFVGRTNSKVYSLRKKTLDEIASLLPIKMLRSELGSAYNDLLNRIVYFISADVGLDDRRAEAHQGGSHGRRERGAGRHGLRYVVRGNRGRGVPAGGRGNHGGHLRRSGEVRG